MPSLIDELTPLQFKVVILMAAGMTMDEVATFLNIGKNVSRTIANNIYRNTQLQGRVALIMRYVDEAERGLYQTNKFKNNVVDLENRARQMMTRSDMEVHAVDKVDPYH